MDSYVYCLVCRSSTRLCGKFWGLPCFVFYEHQHFKRMDQASAERRAWRSKSNMLDWLPFGWGESGVDLNVTLVSPHRGAERNSGGKQSMSPLEFSFSVYDRAKDVIFLPTSAEVWQPHSSIVQRKKYFWQRQCHQSDLG